MSRRPLREDFLLRELDALTRRADVLERRLATVLGTSAVSVAVSQADSTHLAVTVAFSDGSAAVQTIPLTWFTP